MEQEIYRTVDKTLKRLSSESSEPLGFLNHNKVEMCAYQIIDEHKLISFRGDPANVSIISSYADLTEKGRYVLKIGIVAFLAEIKQKENLNFEKLQIDIANARKINKTYWYTFSIAILSFLLSIFLLILKLNEK